MMNDLSSDFWTAVILGKGDPVRAFVTSDNFSDRRITFTSATHFPAGSLCRLDGPELVIIGEVSAESPSPGGWTHTVYLHHLLNKRDIEHIQRRWM